MSAPPITAVRLQRIPATECPNCGSRRLGFDESTSGRAGQFHQGCADCSETTWTGGFEELMAILATWTGADLPILGFGGLG